MEPTTRCNAACPMCARNVNGRTAPGLELMDLSCEDVRKMLPPDLVGQLTGFDLCGAYGDPALAREVAEVVGYVRECNERCAISLYSNGGVRSEKWWRRLAATLGEHGRVVFAIDGLGDVNAVYRRGVDFDKVMRNVEAFIAAGGKARWDFLAFRHNEHQVDQCRELSERMGFTEFSVKRTDRFLEPTYDFVPEFQGRESIERFPVYDQEGQVVDHLEMPTNPALVNKTALHRNDLLGRYASLDKLFDETPIRCRVLDTGSLFVSSSGHVYPCCWTYVQATRPSIAGFPAGVDRQVQNLVRDTGGFDRLDARQLDVAEIVTGEFFTAVADSWSRSSVADGRLKVCARACGEDFPAYFDQFDDSELVPRSLEVRRQT